MKIQPITMDELIGTFMPYEIEHQNEEGNSKGTKVIAFKANHDDTGDQISLGDEGNDEDMALST